MGPNCVISNSIMGIFVVDQAPRKIKMLVRETPFLRKTIATGNEAYNGPEENEPRAILKINNNQRGETRQDNHVGRHSERQIE